MQRNPDRCFQSLKSSMRRQSTCMCIKTWPFVGVIFLKCSNPNSLITSDPEEGFRYIGKWILRQFISRACSLKNNSEFRKVGQEHTWLTEIKKLCTIIQKFRKYSQTFLSDTERWWCLWIFNWSVAAVQVKKAGEVYTAFREIFNQYFLDSTSR